MPKCDKYHAKWKANMAKCSKYHAKCRVIIPKCSKYHAKWQVLVPNCCKYKARKENQKKSKTWGKKMPNTILHPIVTRNLALKQAQHKRNVVFNQLPPFNLLFGRVYVSWRVCEIMVPGVFVHVSFLGCSRRRRSHAQDIPGFSNHPGPRLPNKTPFVPSRSQQSALRRNNWSSICSFIYTYMLLLYTDNIFMCILYGHTYNMSVGDFGWVHLMAMLFFWRVATRKSMKAMCR